MSLQNKRLKLEELDVIENEISKRLRRNPQIWTSSSSHNILGGKKRSLKETLLQQHEVKLFLQQYESVCQSLQGQLVPVESVADEDLSEFDRLYQELKEFHDKYPDRPIDNISSVYLMFGSDTNAATGTEHLDSKGKKRRLRRSILSKFASNLNINTIFSDEEHLGNYLDLVIFHENWLNLPGNESKLSYSAYLNVFNKFQPLNTTLDTESIIDRGSSEYVEYIHSLCSYLKNFHLKIQPLSRPEVSLTKIEADFDAIWKKYEAGEVENEFTHNDKENFYEASNDTESVRCTVCDKEFSKFTVYKGHVKSKKHLKNVADKAKPKISAVSKADVYKILKAEYEITQVSALLGRQISATRTNVERRKLLTDHERSLELESLRKLEEDELFESESGSGSESELEDDGVTYDNPLKLPIGVEGKPIPYWLFKLNGLGLEFSCQVCGNFVYQGRKNYVAHFGEAKHLNGLKCLGVDTSMASVFKGISRIDDVLKLKEKYSLESKRESNFLENVEEVEDEEGNVMSRRDYEDLKKQGLI